MRQMIGLLLLVLLLSDEASAQYWRGSWNVPEGSPPHDAYFTKYLKDYYEKSVWFHAYICRAQIDGAIYPGTVIDRVEDDSGGFRDLRCRISIKDKPALATNKFQWLVGLSEHTWVRAEGGVPNGALIGGNDKENLFYVCRPDEPYFPGRVRESHPVGAGSTSGEGCRFIDEEGTKQLYGRYEALIVAGVATADEDPYPQIGPRDSAHLDILSRSDEIASRLGDRTISDEQPAHSDAGSVLGEAAVNETAKQSGGLQHGNLEARLSSMIGSLEEGVNRPGADFYSFESASAESCRKVCQSESRCLAFTYVKPDAKDSRLTSRCWLKNAIPDAVAHPGCVSGVKGSP